MIQSVMNATRIPAAIFIVARVALMSTAATVARVPSRYAARTWSEVDVAVAVGDLEGLLGEYQSGAAVRSIVLSAMRGETPWIRCTGYC